MAKTKTVARRKVPARKLHIIPRRPPMPPPIQGEGVAGKVIDRINARLIKKLFGVDLMKKR